jgi:GNAT superfamily N-acetyltransferase
MCITQVETEDAEAQSVIFRGIDAYNDTVSGRPEPGRRLAVTLPGPDGRAIGGLFGYTYYDWLHLQLLAVLPARRGRGLGRALLRAAEAEAARRGCRAAWAEVDPDTAGFLERQGWREFGRLDDGPPATHRRFLARDLATGAAVPGPNASDTISSADVAVLDAAVPPPPRRPLGLLVRDDAGHVEGGLWGWSEQGRLFVQLLFLPEQRRRRGLGSALMARAGAVARRRHCRVIWLDTFSFQARPFYERLGFSCFATLADYPPGGARHFLVKRLEEG